MRPLLVKRRKGASYDHEEYTFSSSNLSEAWSEYFTLERMCRRRWSVERLKIERPKDYERPLRVSKSDVTCNFSVPFSQLVRSQPNLFDEFFRRHSK